MPGGVQVTVTQTFEQAGPDKAVYVAEALGRLFTDGRDRRAATGERRG